MKKAEDEYRIFSTNPNVRCKLCAFLGDRAGGTNFECLLLRDNTNPFATCNKFRRDREVVQKDNKAIE